MTDVAIGSRMRLLAVLLAVPTLVLACGPAPDPPPDPLQVTRCAELVRDIHDSLHAGQLPPHESLHKGMEDACQITDRPEVEPSP